MYTPRSFVGGVARSLLGLCLSLLLANAAWGQAATQQGYQILLDTDNNPLTGCAVQTVDGPFAGIDQQLVTTVVLGANTATVSGVQLLPCENNGFGGAPVWTDPGGWPVGLGNGAGGAAVIETFLPLAQVNGPGPLRLGVIAEAGQARDALLLAGNGQGGGGAINLPLPAGPGPGPDATAIPVLNPLTLVLFIALLGGALRYGRRHPGAARLLALVVVVGSAGLVWAARDGQTTDWQGIAPLATDASGDAAPPVDLIALFGKVEGANLSFRIDARITPTSPGNRNPQITSTPGTTATVGQPYSYDVDATDPDGDSLTYSLTAFPPGMTINATTGLIEWTPQANQTGSPAVAVQVSDGRGGTAPQNFTIQVAAPAGNQSPVANAGLDQAVTAVATVQLHGGASRDPDGDPLAYQWAFTAKPATTAATLSDSAAVAPSFVADAAGTYTLSLTVQDGRGGNSSASVNVLAAAPNRAPTITSTPVTTATAGQAYGYPVTATDPDSDPLTFFLQSAPAGMSIDSASGAIQWTPQANQAGAHEVAVLVNDGRGGTATQSFTVQVSAAGNLPPVANPDGYETRLGETLTVPAPGVLGNDVAPNGGALTAAKLTDPTKGALTAFNADGGFTYQAPPTLPGPVFQPVVKAKADPATFGIGFWRWVPVVVDVDRDGIPEIITNDLNSDGTGIAVWHFKDGVLKWLWNRSSFPAPFDDCMGPNGGLPQPIAAGDIDDSGEIALVFPVQCGRDQSGGLYMGARYMAVNGRDGTPQWLSPTMSEARGPGGNAYPLTWGTIPLITRLRPGESPSIVFGRDLLVDTFAGKPLCDQVVPDWPANTPCRAVFVLDGKDGTLRQKMAAEGYVSTVSQYSYPAVVAADLEGNGKLNFVYGSSVFNPDGSTRWSVTDPNKGAKIWWNGLGNFDDTPDIEIVRVEGRADDYVVRLAVYKADGRLLWRTPSIAGGSDNGIPVVADVDGSGRPAVVLNFHQYVCAIDYRGNYKWCYDGGVDTSPHNIGGGVRIAVYDLDGDGVPEVIVPLFNERLVFLDGATGAVKYDFNMAAANGSPPGVLWYPHQIGSPLIADFAGNGHASILSLWSANTGAWRMNLVGAQNDDWQPARTIFNQTSYHVGNVEDDGTIPPSFVNNFATPATNVFGTQAQVLKPVDPRLKTQTTFTYQASSGALASAPATVTIDIQPQNRPPKFVSTPPTRWSGVYPSVFDYAAQAVDPDVGDTLTYSIRVASGDHAADCTIHPTTGAFHCNVLYSGDYGFVITATDSQGATAYQTISLIKSTGTAAVPDVVGQPQATAETTITGAGFTVGDITSMPNAAPVGQVLAQSPAAGTSTFLGERIALTVSKGPAPGNVPDVVGQTQAEAEAALVAAGLKVGTVSTAPSATLAAGRVIAQTPAAGANVAPGTAVNLVVSSGIVSLQGLASLVVEPATPLIVVGQSQAFTATGVFDDGTSLNLTGMVTWTSGTPAVASLSAAGMAAGLTAGTTPIRATVNGITGSTDLTVRAFAPGDATEPTAAITAPTEGAEVTGPVDVTGTATDANFLKYELAYAPAGETHFTVLATGATPVTNGVLGKLDPTLLLNDQYTLRLTVYDRGGNASEASVTVQVARDLKVGNFNLTFTDAQVRLSGLPIIVQRVYDSRDQGQGDFGIGWRLDVQTLRLRTNRVLGTGWVRSQAGAVINLSPTSPHKVSLTLPDGKVEEFDLQVSPTSGFGGLDQTRVVGFAPRPGTLGTLEALANGNLLIVNAGAADELVDDVTFNTYDPQLYRYTTVDGAQIEIHRTEGVKKVTDLNGNTLTFGPGGILHSSGKSVTFSRDAQGRITQITDPMGNVQTYGYDANGDLISHTDAVGNTTRFVYNRQHGLLRMTDPLGRQVARNEYDDSGRLIAVTSANGRRISFGHNLNTRHEVVTDVDGNATVLEYDDKGQVTRVTDAFGGVTTQTYNAAGDQTSTTNPLGETTTRTFDQRHNLLSVTNALGQTATRTYNSRNQVTSIVDPLGQTTRFTYDSRGNLLVRTNGAGIAEETNTYDAQGNLLTRTDGAGAVTQFSYDTFGNVIVWMDPRGNRQEFTYDAQGNILSEKDRRGGILATTYDPRGLFTQKRDPLGNVAAFAYDAVTSMTAVTDAAGNRTERTLDAEGRDLTYRDPAGNTSTRAYDAKGNLIRVTSPSGQATQFEYDALDRRIKTIYPDGAFETLAYDAAGRNTTRTDANGHTTAFAYDAAGRLIRTTDALGGVTRLEYDAAGNLIKRIDALGNTFTYAYDATNRRIRTTLPDGNTESVSYDGAGRKISETDAAGHITRFEYDGNGNLAKVIDAAGGVTRFDYDAENNLLVQTDANGHTTTYAYDANGRRVQATLPAGQNERYEYDAAGNVFRTTTRKNDVLLDEFDGAQRQTARIYPDGGRIAFSYTGTGKVSTATDSRGVTSYGYDARDRVTRIDHPDGSSLAYAYDAVGNRASVTTRTSATAPAKTTRYTYDALNRLATVTDPNGRVTAYAYDAIGNLQQSTYPNGTSATFAYNARSLLQILEHRRGATVLDSFTYTVNAVGDRTRVQALDGSFVTYEYDVLRQLTRETQHDTAGSVVYDIAYTYDAVGNRLTQTRSGGIPIVYAYDSNDRLLSLGGVTFGYDANGNTTSRTQGGQTTAYTYDFENRLTRVVPPNGSATDYGYDPQGNRIRKSGVSGTTRYLVDPVNPTGVAQVLEEYNDGGGALASYVYGNQLLSQQRGSQTSFYHRDGVNSIRLLTDGGGAVTDQYTFDAFGQPLAQTGSTPNVYRFAGEQFDSELGLYYLRARYYSPETGRFFSVDPFAGFQTDPKSLHRYLCAHVNPVNFSDPSGRLTLAETLVVNFNLNILMSVAIDVLLIKEKNPDKIAFNAISAGVFGAISGAVGGKIGAIFAKGLIGGPFSISNVIVNKLLEKGLLRVTFGVLAAAVDTIFFISEEVFKSRTFDGAWALPSAEKVAITFGCNFIVKTVGFNVQIREIQQKALNRLASNKSISPDLANALMTEDLFDMVYKGRYLEGSPLKTYYFVLDAIDILAEGAAFSPKGVSDLGASMLELGKAIWEVFKGKLGDISAGASGTQ